MNVTEKSGFVLEYVWVRKEREEERLKNAENKHPNQGISSQMEFAEEDFARDRYGLLPVNPTTEKQKIERKLSLFSPLHLDVDKTKFIPKPRVQDKKFRPW